MHPAWRLAFLWLLLTAPTTAQDVRERTRPPRQEGTTVTASQAEALTLTVGAVAPRVVQTWVRTAGVLDKTRTILSARLSGRDAALVKVGQRVRAFAPTSKSSMSQAFITRIVPHPDGVEAQATLTSASRQEAAVYVMEIVAERGPLLSVPNEAIIEEGERHVVYVQKSSGEFVPQDITLGVQGELFTEVLSGVREDDQVVTFGSFFIDAEHKLKGTEADAPGRP